MRRHTSIVAVLLLITVSGACSGDKVLMARKVMRDEPEEAVGLLLEAQKERAHCLECSIYLGLAYERLGDLDKAASAYEQALEADNPWSRPEPVPARLLHLYRKMFEQKNSAQEKIDIARKAAALEKRLKVAVPWANRYLFEEYHRRMSRARRSRAMKQFLEMVDNIEALYLPVSQKKRVAQEATEFMKSQFVDKGVRAIQGPLGARLRQAGFLSEDGKSLKLMHQFKIPHPSEDQRFDPKSRAFGVALRSSACLPLRKQLAEALAIMKPALGLEGLDSQALDALYARLFPYARAGFAALKHDARRPAGQPYLCMVSVPVVGFLKELFPFSESR